MAYFPEKVTLNPSTPASDVHTFNGNIVFGTTEITSFSSATSRYFGNKSAALTMSLGSTSSGGGFNLYINSYFDGTDNRFTIANETAGRITTAGQTSAASGFYYLQANNNVSHAADATLSFTTVHSVDSNGLHTIGSSSSNNSLVHQLYGSLNLLGAVIPSYSSTRYRYIGNKLSSSLYDNGSGSAAGGTAMYGNVYFDGTGTKRSRANETCSSVSVGGATSASTVVFAVSADNSIVSAADSAVTLTSLLTVDSNGAHVIGNSSSNNSQIQQIYGSVNLNGTAIPSFSSSTIRYVGNKISSVQFLTGAASTTGTLSAYGNCYFDGTNTKFTIANETAARLTVAGGTATSSFVYTLSADVSISHAADATMSLVNLHTIDATGAHVIGNATTNNSLVHVTHGSIINGGSFIPSFSSSSLRYFGAKLSSLIIGAGSTTGYVHANCYNDGTNTKRSAGSQNSCRLSVIGNSTNIFTVDYDGGGTVDTNVSFTSYFNIDQNANSTIGVSGTSSTQTLYGAVSVTNTSTSSAHVFYSNASGTSTVPFRIARSSTGASNVFLACSTGASSAGSPGTDQGGVRINGANTALEFFWSSDVKLKTNIREFTGALDKVKALRTSVYDWKDPELPNNCVGFIAQDMATVVPEAVFAASKDKNGEDILAIGTQSLIPYLWAAVRELLERVEKLESKKKIKKDEE